MSCRTGFRASPRRRRELTANARARRLAAGALIPALVGAVSDGCGTSDWGSAEAQARTSVTFYRDVAPVINEHCVACHNPNGSAPFGLMTYDEVKRHAHAVLAATEARRMPPWLPEPGFGDFVGERRLTDEEIRILRGWVEGGLEQGSSRDRPPAPRLPGSWRLGEPNLIVEMPPYQVPATGRDIYRNFVVAADVAETRYVRSVELVPGNPRVVHHARLMVDPTPSSRRLDESDPEPGYDGMHLMSNAQNPDGHFVGWTPGKEPRLTPDSTAWQLEPGSDLVLQLHLRPTGQVESVAARVGFYFADGRPSRQTVVLMLGSESMDIPAGESDYLVEDGYVLPVDVSALGVYPHAHYLAQEMQGFATLPDGTMRWLIRILDWDFNWQDEYWFANPVFLPEGTTITMRYHYDNSSANPQNPHEPPRRVKWGPSSTDEMADLLIQVLPADPSNVGVLQTDFAEHMRPRELARLARAHHNAGVRLVRGGDLRGAIARFEQALQLKPDLASTHNALANALTRTGDLPAAIEHYREALQLEGDYAEAHFNLANVLRSERRLDEAITHYRDAVRLAPDLAEAHYNLAVVLEARGASGEAVDHYTRAVAARPDFVEARFNLGNALAARGSFDSAMSHYRIVLERQPEHAEARNNLAMALMVTDRAHDAVTHFREAARLRPDWPTPLVNLGRILAMHPDPSVRNPERAVASGERAVRLTNRRDPVALEVLAAAYASAGRFERAAATIREAIPLASAAGADDLVAHLRERLALYQEGRTSP